MLEFDEKLHQYTLDGKKLISVTQLMQKHGLGPTYAGVSSEVLSKKAERGTLIHQEIEDFNKTGEIGFTGEVALFRDYVARNELDVLESECRVHNDIVAGTIDLILEDSHFKPIIADIKTTYTLHQEAVSWQLSIYLKLWFDTQKIPFTWENWRGQAFHFNKDGELNVVDIPLKPFEEIEKLMNCERNGEIYKQELQLNENKLNAFIALENMLKNLDEEKKEIQAKQDELKAALLEELESRGIKSFENDKIKITYVAPSKRVTLDSKGVREKYPDIYEEFSKETETKASVRITLKVETRPQINKEVETR